MASTVPLVRLKTALRGSPGLLGFSALITPDQYGDNDPEFKARVHWNEDQVGAFAVQVQKVMDDNAEELKELLAKAKAKPFKVQSAEAWLNDAMADPKEGARIQLPSIQFKRSASYVNKEGETVPLTVKFYDRSQNLLDGAKLRTGMGSLVQPVLTPSVWCGKFSNGFIAPSFRLEGLVILKNEPWGSGGQGANAGDYDDAQIDALVGADMDLDDDLSAFAQSATRTEDPKRLEEPRATAGEDWDLSDEIPF